MAVPDYQSIMLPLLQFAGDQQEYSLQMKSCLIFLKRIPTAVSHPNTRVHQI